MICMPSYGPDVLICYLLQCHVMGDYSPGTAPIPVVSVYTHGPCNKDSTWKGGCFCHQKLPPYLKGHWVGISMMWDPDGKNGTKGVLLWLSIVPLAQVYERHSWIAEACLTAELHDSYS